MGSYSSIAGLLVARVEAHCAAGRLLEGWKFHGTPTNQLDGIVDFPSVRVFVPEASETRLATFKKTGTLNLDLLVGTRRSKGLVVHLKALEAVMDAVETNPETLLADIGFGGALDVPPDMRFGDSGVTDNGWFTTLFIEFNIPRFMPGQRRVKQ